MFINKSLKYQEILIIIIIFNSKLSVLLSKLKNDLITNNLKVDGITKYVEDYEFNFDNSFHQNEDTETLYKFDC